MITALGHPDRVCSLDLPVRSSVLGKVTTVSLAQLWLSTRDGITASPDPFLDQYTPRLGKTRFGGDPIYIYALPTFLSSASDLVALYLDGISYTRYVSPDAIVTSLAALTRLNSFSIGFHTSTFRPNQSTSSGGRVAPPTQLVLRVLTFFLFKGASEYLEDLVAHIDAPHLTSIHVTYFNQLVFQVPQLFRFIGQTQIIEQTRTLGARVHLYPSSIHIGISSRPAETPLIFLGLQISSQGLDRQVSHLCEALSQLSAVLSNVRHLSIEPHHVLPKRSWRDDMDMNHIKWLALLRWFTAVETLRVFYQIAGHVTDALEDVTAAMAPEILPALRLLHLECESERRVEEFINARRLSGLPPVTFASTVDEFLAGLR